MHISFQFPRAPEFFVPMMLSLVEDFVSSSLQGKKQYLTLREIFDRLINDSKKR